jgi:hypothetical protein
MTKFQIGFSSNPIVDWWDGSKSKFLHNDDIFTNCLLWSNMLFLTYSKSKLKPKKNCAMNSMGCNVITNFPFDNRVNENFSFYIYVLHTCFKCMTFVCKKLQTYKKLNFTQFPLPKSLHENFYEILKILFYTSMSS